jgi:prepilin peptidase CpaA
MVQSQIPMPMGGRMPIFVGSTFRVVGGIVLFGLLCVAAAYDVRARRIPNWLVVLIAVLGLGFSAVTGPGLRGLLTGVAALLVGLAIWLPSWLLRWLGAGDVKLFAAASAWLGVKGAIEGAVFGGLVGGILAVVWILRFGMPRMRGRRTMTLPPIGQPTTGRAPASTLPYSVALAAGAEIAAWFPHLLFR